MVVENVESAENIEDTKLEIAKITEPNLVDNALEENTEVAASSLSSSELRNKALDLRSRINRAAIELAEVLHAIYHGEKWRDFGFETFADYVEAELEVGYRSAMYSVKIISTMKEHNISMEQAKLLGWGRLRAILPHITAHNVGSLLDMATSRSVRQIENELAESGVTVPQVETHKLVVDCSASEAAVIFDALDEAKRRLDTESTSAALEFCLSEWNIANEGEASQTSLQDVINFCERNYGVTLTAGESSPEIEDVIAGSG